jgi:hypothetical protein
VKRTPTFRLPTVGLTREQYYELVERRNGRPLTMTDPIHKRTVDDGTQSDGMTPMERVIAESNINQGNQ